MIIKASIGGVPHRELGTAIFNQIKTLQYEKLSPKSKPTHLNKYDL